MYAVEKASVSVVLMAAGLSTRMGQNKLLLPFGEKSVIQHTLDNLIASRACETIVVIGSKAIKMHQAVSDRDVIVVYNPDYTNGMSTSLKTGIRMVNESVKYIMIALGDQPFISSLSYNYLIDATQKTSKLFLVPTYHGERGNPIMMSAKLCSELYRQDGDIGGRELLKKYSEDMCEIPLEDEGIVINMNTIQEYQKRMKYLNSCPAKYN